MDVSADLIELGRTPICVVSSGIKSILDIPRTLEYLETQGVCVAAYQSDTGHFPAFYTRSSGVKAPYNLKTPQEAALMIKSSLDLQLQSGILIGVPIPKKYAADGKYRRYQYFYMESMSDLFVECHECIIAISHLALGTGDWDE